jgi:hypothetical protein
MSLELPPKEPSPESGNEQQQSPVDIDPVNVILGIREELAEFKKAGGKEALRAAMRKACEEALLQTMRGLDPDSFERALSEPDGIIEHLRDRGVIPPPPSRWKTAEGRVAASPQAGTANPRRRRRRKQEDALGRTPPLPFRSDPDES